MFNEVAEGVNEPNDNELPPEVRNQSKSQLYSATAFTFFLPSKHSRATSKLYLHRVQTNQVFRVTRQAILEFESRLQPDECVRVSFLNIPMVVARLNRLLVQLGLPDLSFTATTMPDDDWVFRVVRFVDQNNLLGCFKRAVRNAQPPNIMAATM